MKPREKGKAGRINGIGTGSCKKDKDFKLATWNLRSLYRPGALKILIGEVLKYKIDVLAMQEMRWTGAGIMDRRDYSVYYSCQNRDHALGKP